jgi:hypothetical protein
MMPMQSDLSCQQVQRWLASHGLDGSYLNAVGDDSSGLLDACLKQVHVYLADQLYEPCCSFLDWLIAHGLNHALVFDLQARCLKEAGRFQESLLILQFMDDSEDPEAVELGRQTLGAFQRILRDGLFQHARFHGWDLSPELTEVDWPVANFTSLLLDEINHAENAEKPLLALALREEILIQGWGSSLDRLRWALEVIRLGSECIGELPKYQQALSALEALRNDSDQELATVAEQHWLDVQVRDLIDLDDLQGAQLLVLQSLVRHPDSPEMRSLLASVLSAHDAIDLDEALLAHFELVLS